MALSRKNKRKLERLRRDADRLWGDQQEVLAKARDLGSRGVESARDYADAEVLPAIRKNVENVRPAFERGVESGRSALHKAESALQRNVLPAIAQAGGNVTGAVREFVDSNKTVQQVQSRGESIAKEAVKRVEELQKQIAKEQKKQKKSGIGVGGWFAIGAGVAALAAIGYALWQTFRADDDLWIADEELDAPVETVTRNN
ncbi:hypothetical protein [Gulosibacter chungangensis]|uniref:DNA helicase n=1 Tax=Gulosibacter chungangensis TaxID=979746 RepID=A0A7J5BG74_9MICO|nr:hypothetical protein [Gulosibacter chungangensis]KAB1645276.1 hypothetical protein F8O05_03290 [Gulosibacter chungangensis]